MLEIIPPKETRYRILLPSNNLELAIYLEYFQGDKQSEYDRLVPLLSFKVKSFGYLMKRYEQWKKDHGTSTNTES